MEIFDILIYLNHKKQITEYVWKEPELEREYGLFWNDCIGRTLAELLGVTDNQGRVNIEGREFSYAVIPTDSGKFMCFLKKENNLTDLYEEALDYFPFGVQVYDKNGYMKFCNRTSRRISIMPPLEDIRGKHLTDIWKVTEGVSTTLSCLREKKPIINRVDTFPSVSKGNVTTANTAYPLIRDKVQIGAVLFERDELTVRQQSEELETVKNAFERHSKTREVKLTGYNFEYIIGNSSGILMAKNLAGKFAPQNCNILLIGETGTGKEMFAQSIHYASGRKDKPFVAVNCAAVPETLIESMLFGTQKGAFTGSENKAGLFEEANGGTFFLDELNSMSLMMQSKILRVIQEGIYRRVGSNKDSITDVRIISSCNEDPFELMEKNIIRRDLFYRLSTVQIKIPPLRDRTEDLDILVSHYLEVNNANFAKEIDYIAPEVMTLFKRYAWKGNVRELYHVLDYAMNIVEKGVIDVTCLPSYLLENKDSSQEKRTEVTELAEADLCRLNLDVIMGKYESQVLKKVLEYNGNHISKTAKSLGICRQSLSYRIHKYGITI